MAGMEGRDCAHALDLVDMAARLRERLAEQRLRRTIAEQQQTLGRASWMCWRAISAQASRSAALIRAPGAWKQESEAL